MAKGTKNILFINFGGLGDEILFLPAIQSVKAKHPDSRITLVLEPRSKGICELTDVIDEVIFADVKKNKYKELLNLLFRIWGKSFDIVIASGANKFMSLFLFCTLIPKRVGYNSGKLSEIVLTRAIPLNKNQYAAKMYHDLVRCVTDIDTELPKLSVETKPIEQNTILIHPGVSQMSIKKGMVKTVPAKTWAEVVMKLSDSGKKVILIGGPDDKEVIETIKSIVPPEKYILKTPKNLKELAELISGAEKFLCSDSAPLHIASALKVMTYAIFGSTDDKKLIPDNGRVTPIKANCSCPLQPCLWEKRQTTCETLDCLKLSADEIVNAILKD